MLLTDEQILALLGLAAIGSERDGRLLNALLQNIEYTCLLEVDLREDNVAGRSPSGRRIELRVE